MPLPPPWLPPPRRTSASGGGGGGGLGGGGGSGGVFHDPHPYHHHHHDHHHHLPAYDYWRALIRKLHRRTDPGGLLLATLDLGLLSVFAVGAWGALASADGLRDPACRDVSSYVALLTLGLGLYLAQLALHRLQRRLLIALWDRTYNNNNKTTATTLLQQPWRRAGDAEGARRKKTDDDADDEQQHHQVGDRPDGGGKRRERLAAEDVVAHVRGLQRLEALKRHASPGLPVLFLFSWLYAGAVDAAGGGDCALRYPALVRAYRVFSWAGYTVAAAFVLALVAQCLFLWAGWSWTFPAGAAWWGGHASFGPSPPSSSQASAAAGRAVAPPPPAAAAATTVSSSTSSIATTASAEPEGPLGLLAHHLLPQSPPSSAAWLGPARRALTLVLGPLSVLLPTELEPAMAGPVAQRPPPPLPAAAARPPPSVIDVDGHGHPLLLAPGGAGQEEGAQAEVEEEEMGATSDRGPGPLRPLSSIGATEEDEEEEAGDGTWLLAPGIVRTALEASPFGVAARRVAARAAARRMTGMRPPPPTAAAAPAVAVAHPISPRSLARRLALPFASIMTSSSSSGSSLSAFRLLCAALWACLHVAIVALVAVAIYLLGTTASLPAQKLEACAAVRGYLFTLSTGFSAYATLALWLWAEKERSIREDPHEHALKGLWLLRALVCLLSIGFLWGTLVLGEKGCFDAQPQLHEAVVAYILLGSSLLALAVALHGVATAVWACASLVRVAHALGETAALALSLLLGLRPHQDLLLLVTRGASKAPAGMNVGVGTPSSMPSAEREEREGEEEEEGTATTTTTEIAVAEELPLLPFFHIRVIPQWSGGGGAAGAAAAGADGTTSATATAAAPPGTPVGRRVRPQRPLPSRRRNRSRVAFHQDQGGGDGEDHSHSHGHGHGHGDCVGEESIVDDAQLPAAVPVVVSAASSFGDGTYDRRASSSSSSSAAAPLLTAATLESMFDVTPLSSLSPLRRRAGPAVVAAAAAAGGGSAESLSGPVHAHGNTCCPLPPPPPRIIPPSPPRSLAAAAALAPQPPLWAASFV